MVSSQQAVEEFLMDDLEQACLDSVLSLTEACKMYSKSRTTIIDLVQSGKLKGRQARFGTMWFILKRSCDERWPDYGRS